MSALSATPKLTPIKGIAHEYFEIDMCLASESCGGPVVTLDFEAVAISFRSDIYGASAIPASQVMKLLDDVQ